jgi:heme/copper-type cytochrome/quinol oxidase subunit 1
MFLLGITGALINWPGSTLQLTQFSITSYGMDILAIYGCFSFLMFGAIYFIVPRVTRREWLSKRFIKLHFLFSMYGVITVAVLSVLGGLLHGHVSHHRRVVNRQEQEIVRARETGFFNANHRIVIASEKTAVAPVVSLAASDDAKGAGGHRQILRDAVPVEDQFAGCAIRQCRQHTDLCDHLS